METHKVGRRLFFRFTDLAVRLTQRSERTAPTVTKPVSTVTPPHDETVTPGQDRTVTSIRDEYLPANIDETGTRESGRKETPPVSPSEGEAGSAPSFSNPKAHFSKLERIREFQIKGVFELWNSLSQLTRAATITPNRVRQLRKLLDDPFWRTHCCEGIQRAAASPFLTGNGSQGWRATFDWFLRGDSLLKIIEGAYDNRTQ